jgi:hypothetical protein
MISKATLTTAVAIVTLLAGSAHALPEAIENGLVSVMCAGGDVIDEDILVAGNAHCVADVPQTAAEMTLREDILGRLVLDFTVAGIAPDSMESGVLLSIELLEVHRIRFRIDTEPSTYPPGALMTSNGVELAQDGHTVISDTNFELMWVLQNGTPPVTGTVTLMAVVVPEPRAAALVFCALAALAARQLRR